MDRIDKYSRYLFFILFAVLTVSSIHRTIMNDMDFLAFHRTVLLFLNGDFDFYNIIRDKVFTFKYGPIFPLIIFPFGFLSLATAKVVWACINAASLIVAWTYSEKLIRLSRPDLNITYPARLLTLIMVLDIVSRNAMQGNINVMLFAVMIISIVWSIEGKNKRAALLAAITASIKITPGILLIFFLVSKNKKTFWYSAAFCIVLFILLPLSVFGLESSYNMYLNWISVLRDVGHFPFYKHTNQSPVAVMFHLTGNNSFGLVSTIIFGLACTWYIRHFYIKKDIFGIFTGCMLTYISLSPIVWIEYHIVMLPVLLLISSMLLQKMLSRSCLMLFVLRFLMVHVFVTAVVGEKLGIATAMFGQHLIGSWLAGIILLLCLTSVPTATQSPK